MLLLVFLSFVASCGVAHQPKSAKTVAAFEIPLSTEEDRADFLDMLRRRAEAEGMHVDAATSEELEHTGRVIPEAKRTIRAAVWRGSNDDEFVASILDFHDHLGPVWITFSRGEDPEIATRFRERLMHEVRERWPDTLALPIMPTGAIPLHDDLVRTPDGYVVDPAAASKYELEVGE
jgi:hypothetical protein